MSDRAFWVYCGVLVLIWVGGFLVGVWCGAQLR